MQTNQSAQPVPVEEEASPSLRKRVTQLEAEVRELRASVRKQQALVERLLRNKTKLVVYRKPIEEIISVENATPKDLEHCSRLIHRLHDGTSKVKGSDERKLAGPVKIRLVSDLLKWNEEELLSIEGMGHNLYSLLVTCLERQNLYVGQLA